MSLRILNTIPFYSAEARAHLEKLGVVEYMEVSNETISNSIGEYEVLVVGLGCTYSASVLSGAPKLKVIATATTGLDHIDLAYAEAHNIAVVSLRGEHAFLDTITGTAELAFGFLLALVRKLPQAHHHVAHDGLWDRELFRGTSLYGKTLGIVGMGRLGRIMARAAHGFRMKVVYYDPLVSAEENPEYQKVSFEELLAESDAVAIHCHLIPETEKMFNEEAFSRMKKGAYLINTARGGIVDEGALLRALDSGHLAGYATDVLEGELQFKEGDAALHPLVAYARTHDTVLLSPHIGGMTTDSRIATDIFIAQKLARFLVEGS